MDKEIGYIKLIEAAWFWIVAIWFIASAICLMFNVIKSPRRK